MAGEIPADCTHFLVLSENSVLQSLSGVIDKYYFGVVICLQIVTLIGSTLCHLYIIWACYWLVDPKITINPGCECRDFLQICTVVMF